MLKGASTLLGIGLMILWMAGLGNQDAKAWFAWLDAVAALGAFGIAAFVPMYAKRSVRVLAPLALSVGLFALWIIGLANGVAPWSAWWTFGFACAFLILTLACSVERRPPLGRTQAELDREQYRRSA